MAALITCPQPMRARLLRWFQGGSESVRDVVLEVAARRYYRTRDLGDVRLLEIDGPAARGDRVPATTVTRSTSWSASPRSTVFPRSSGPSAALGRRPRRLRADPRHAPLAGTRQPDDVEAIGERLRTHDRVDRPWPTRSPHRRDDHDRTIRHAARKTPTTTRFGRPRRASSRTASTATCTRCWRSGSISSGCAEFAIDRLDSAEDVYLFRGIAHLNPNDERLFALAEVRDLTPVTDETGTIGWASADGAHLTEALAAIRRLQSHRPPGPAAAAQPDHLRTCGRPGPCRATLA